MTDLRVSNIDAALVHASILARRHRLVQKASKREHTIGVLCVVRRIGRVVATVDDKLFVVACPRDLMLYVAVDVGLADQLVFVVISRS